MKKLIALLLVLIISLSLVSCADRQENYTGDTQTSISQTESVPADDVNEIGKNEAESENEGESFVPENATGDMTTATQIMSEEQNGELPEIEGPDGFLEQFVLNPIDAYYIENMEMASSLSGMLDITNNTMMYWETEVNSVYSELMMLLGEDSEEFSKIKAEQKAFNNDLKISADEIKENAEASMTGSMINIEISYRIMLLYRGRAVELLCSAYNVTGEVNVEIITDAAG
ncbi:MAG: hypothetical protein E7564_04025 [Ruminococcaceae bacterium]|nr:hypothetical protein [Oscillospiraceae bacterium]